MHLLLQYEIYKCTLDFVQVSFKIIITGPYTLLVLIYLCITCIYEKELNNHRVHIKFWRTNTHLAMVYLVQY